jgi:hypothetical protein
MMHLLLMSIILFIQIVVPVAVFVFVFYLKLTPPMTLDELFECIPARGIDLLPRICGQLIYNVLGTELDERSHYSLTDSAEMIFIKAENHRGGLTAYFSDGKLSRWWMDYENKPRHGTGFRERAIIETMLTRIHLAIERSQARLERQSQLSRGA